MTDSLGIAYTADPSTSGHAVDVGSDHHISRASEEDQRLYQTERYSLSTFSYDFPLPENGKYVLWLKFSEVYFMSSMQKVFHVAINGDTPVISNLDIYSNVGRDAAYDEYVPFSVKGEKLEVDGHVIDYKGTLLVSFIKTNFDNPKVNAILVYKGDIADIPRLAPIDVPVEPTFAGDSFVDEDDVSLEYETPPASINARNKAPVDRVAQNFYELDESEDDLASPLPSSVFTKTTLIAIGATALAFLPVAYFLHRL